MRALQRWTTAALFLCWAALATTAQVIVDDRFDQPTVGPWAGARTPGSEEVTAQDGVLILARTPSSGVWAAFRDGVALDTGRNWSVRAVMRSVAGDGTLGYGITFGAADNRNFMAAVLTTGGTIQVGRWQQARYADVQGWTKAEANPPGTWNTLEVRRRGQYCAYLLNDKVVATWLVPQYPTMGTRIGLFVSRSLRVEVDAFTVSSTPLDTIRVVAGGMAERKRVNLGPAVNGPGMDVASAITADGMTMYLGRKGYPGNVPPMDTDDAWVAERRADGSWAPATNLGAPINNSGGNFVISVLPDNNTLMLAGLYTASGGLATGQGVSLSRRTASGWSIPEKVEIEDFVNRSHFVSYAMCPDGINLIMAVDRPDGYGGRDMFVSHRQPDGRWSKPKNLGPTLNTYGNDITPFMAPDNVTLYFASDGHAGYGGQDLFVSRRLDTTWTSWSEPENLGPYVNTPTFDAHLKMTARGDSLYVSSSQNSIGNEDVFSIATPEGAKPKAVVEVRGIVRDVRTGEPVGGTVVYEDLRTGLEAGRASSSPKTGAYAVVLPIGANYGVRAQSDGYYPKSESLDLRSVSAAAPKRSTKKPKSVASAAAKSTEPSVRSIERNLDLVPIVVGATVRLNNLFFDSNKWDVRPESFSELDRLITFLKSNTNVHIRLDGHTDDVGPDEANLTLSDRRVESVRRYLLDRGVAPDRLTTMGYGETKPLGPNTSEEGRQLNRRVEFEIVKQ